MRLVASPFMRVDSTGNLALAWASKHQATPVAVNNAISHQAHEPPGEKHRCCYDTCEIGQLITAERGNYRELTQRPELCLLHVAELSALGEQRVGNHVCGARVAASGIEVDGVGLRVPDRHTVWG
jgi:hypothetical protein